MAAMRPSSLRPNCAQGVGAWLIPAAILFAAPLAVAAPEAAQPIYTRAQVRSLPSAAEPSVLRLKLLPRGKLPFTTISLAVDRPELLQGIQVGDEVGFVAERRDGRNTVTRLRKLTACVRFQPCPEVRAD